MVGHFLLYIALGICRVVRKPQKYSLSHQATSHAERLGSHRVKHSYAVYSNHIL